MFLCLSCTDSVNFRLNLALSDPYLRRSKKKVLIEQSPFAVYTRFLGNLVKRQIQNLVRFARKEITKNLDCTFMPMLEFTFKLLLH